MTNFKQHILAQKNVAGAACDKGAIAVMHLPDNGLVIWRGAGEVMKWENRGELQLLVEKAAKKLGFKRDRRCKIGFRKI